MRLKQQLATFLPENVTAAMNGSSPSNHSISISTSNVTFQSVNQTGNSSVEMQKNETKLEAIAVTANKTKAKESHFEPSRRKVERKEVAVEAKIPVVRNGSEQIKMGVADRKVTPQEKAVGRKVVEEQATYGGGKPDRMRKDRHLGFGNGPVHRQGEHR